MVGVYCSVCKENKYAGRDFKNSNDSPHHPDILCKDCGKILLRYVGPT